MTIKNMLVAYNGTENAQSALKTAQKLAQRYGAHLTGILAHGLPNLMYSYGGHVPQSAMDQLEAADKRHRNEVRKKFMAETTGFTPEKLHFLDVYGDADEMLMEIALGYDLVVLGAENRHADFPHMEVHADVIARNSGKPVLVVPAGFDPTALNERILLAWDGKRAASRAMEQAIRLQKPGGEIIVLCIGPAKRAEAKARPAVNNLQRHGFAARLLTRKAKKTAKAILATAADENAGLLVMGAYEHAKLAEDLFGGVTNTVLKKAHIPVLLSH